MSDWKLYRGDGKARKPKIPPAPPWRRFDGEIGLERTIPSPSAEARKFQATPELVESVNAALYLRRPLLLTGRPGSGKSSLIEAVARELSLGNVLRWHVTSHSTLDRALYRYDALGRLQDHQLGKRASGDGSAGDGDAAKKKQPDIGDYLVLGPLGTALLPTARPRALLIDEIDKSDIDLPNDLLHVFERGEFEIPELARLKQGRVEIREHDGAERFPIVKGRVHCHEFPFVVLTSNGERDFPAAFLRRCIRFTMPVPDGDLLERIVTAHLGAKAATAASELVADFAKRTQTTPSLATDQLLNAIFMITGRDNVSDDDKTALTKLLLKELRSERT